MGSKNPVAAARRVLEDLARRAPGLGRHRQDQARRRRRLRRLSDAAAALCRDLAQGADADPRAERGDGPRQPGAVQAASTPSPAASCRRMPSAAGAKTVDDRQSGPAAGPGGGEDALHRVRRASEPFRLLVFGGSQGAQFFSDAVPPAIGLLPEAQRKRLVITQQCRPDDVARVKTAYRGTGRRRRALALLHRHAAADGGGASGDLALRRLDRRPNSPSSAGRRCWCPIRMRSTTTRRRMPQPLPRPAAAGGPAERSCRRSASLALTWRADGQSRPAGGHGARRRKSVGRPDAARLLADLVRGYCVQKSRSDFRKGTHR